MKKQSQFVSEQIDVTSYMKGDYDNIPLCGEQENKAKQSQYQQDWMENLRNWIYETIASAAA